MAKRRWTDEHPEVEPVESLPEVDLPRIRQRSPRTDASMRDGDSGHGNPLESEVEETQATTDNDVGDATWRDEPAAGPSGGAVGGTPAGKRARPRAKPGVRYRPPKRGDSTVGGK
jgi:hypothetical protein